MSTRWSPCASSASSVSTGSPYGKTFLTTRPHGNSTDPSALLYSKSHPTDRIPACRNVSNDIWAHPTHSRDQAHDDMTVDRPNSHLSPISNRLPSHSDDDAHRAKRVKVSHVRGGLSDDEAPESRHYGAADLKTAAGR